MLIILDNIRSLYNVGSIMRSMDCVNADEIYLCGITVTPRVATFSNSIKKTALAAYDQIRWRYFKSTLNAVKNAKKRGYKVYIIEQSDKATPLSEITFQFPAAFVFGHEVKGVNTKLFNLADNIVILPNKGASHSWNVSSTAAIVLYEAYQQKISYYEG